MFGEKEKELKWKMLLWDIAIAGMALAGAYGLRVLLPGGEREIDPVAHFSMLPVFLMLMILSLSSPTVSCKSSILRTERFL